LVDSHKKSNFAVKITFVKKVAVLTSRFPFPLERGDKLRIYHQIKQLSQQCEVILIALTDDSTSTEHLQALAQFAKIYTIHTSLLQKGANLLQGWLKGLPLSVANFTNSTAKKRIDKILQEEKPDFLYCQLIRMAEYSKGFEGKKIIDYQDAFSQNMYRRAAKASIFLRGIFKHEAQRLADYEARSFDFFDHHFIISDADRDALHFEKKHQISICKNGIDSHFFQNDAQNIAVEKKYDLVFVGNLGYHPNVEAAQYLVNQIFTKLKITHPNIKILLAGARPTLAVKQLASQNVTISGWMDDIRIAYSEAKIFVAPLFQGSGQQNKVMETMAMGVPCITTSIVNLTTGAKPNHEILIADTVDEFCEKIILMLGDKTLYESIKSNASEFVTQHFSWEGVTKPLLEVME
jgi:polysaccharide biosynthesis protein PslH